MSTLKYSTGAGDPISTKALSSTLSSNGSTGTIDRSGQRRSSEGLIGSPQELASASKLWRSVLGQSVRDLYEGDPKHRKEVFVWLASNDFVTVCDLADVHAPDMREQLAALASLPEQLSKKYGRLLRAKITEDVYRSD